jgi:rhodanese-related sulfurtransferase
MCGRNISADRNSTIGRERATNYALQAMTREEFVERMTQDLPARPEYFQRDVDVNRHGAPAIESLPPMPVLSPAEVQQLQQQGASVLDTRPATPYFSAHIPGSIQIGLGGQFASWAGAILGLDRDVILVAEDDHAAEEARLRLSRVGIDRVVGRLQDGILGWTEAGLPLAEIAQVQVHELNSEMSANPELSVVDVRRLAEFEQGHIPGALLKPLDQLRSGLASLDPNRLTAVHCKSGYRSAIACSLLEAHGFKRLMNVLGGYDAWAGAGLPAVTTRAV